MVAVIFEPQILSFAVGEAWVRDREIPVILVELSWKRIISEMSLKSSCSKTAWCDKSCSLMDKMITEWDLLYFTSSPYNRF